MKTTLAERLNEAMKESGVTPGDLAAACGIRVQAVYQWQSGKTATHNKPRQPGLFHACHSPALIIL